MGPQQRLAVDVFLQQVFAQHQAEVSPGPPPRDLGALVDDMAQLVEPPGVRWPSCRQPAVSRPSAAPAAGREAEDLGFDPAALQRLPENLRTDRRHGDGIPAHGSGVVDQQRDRRIDEAGFRFLLEGKRFQRIDDHPGQTARIQQAFLEVELPLPTLAGHQVALQPMRLARDGVEFARDVGVQLPAQLRKPARVAQFARVHDLIEFGGTDTIGCRVVGGIIFRQAFLDHPPFLSHEIAASRIPPRHVVRANALRTAVVGCRFRPAGLVSPELRLARRKLQRFDELGRPSRESRLIVAYRRQSIDTLEDARIHPFQITVFHRLRCRMRQGSAETMSGDKNDRFDAIVAQRLREPVQARVA